MQIVSTGPDSDVQKIKFGLCEDDFNGEEISVIQNPYFIPGQSIQERCQLPRCLEWTCIMIHVSRTIQSRSPCDRIIIQANYEIRRKIYVSKCDSFMQDNNGRRW